MLSAKRLRLILPAAALLLLLVGAVLFWLNRSSMGSEKAQVSVKLVQIISNGRVLDCKWRITGNRKWGTFSGVTGPGPASRISLKAEDAPFGGLIRTSGSNRLDYQLKVSLGASNAPGQVTYTVTIDMHGANGAAPSSNSSASFSSSSASLDKLVVVNVQSDTIVKLPGRVQLAAIDGKPLVLEFGK